MRRFTLALSVLSAACLVAWSSRPVRSGTSPAAAVGPARVSDTTSVLICARIPDAPLHSGWLPSDSIVVVPESLFVYDELRRQFPDDRYPGNSTNRYALAWQSQGLNQKRPFSLPTQNHIYTLLWCPIERYLPRDVHIISAEICLTALGKQGFYVESTSDTVTAVQLGREGDGRWARGPRFRAAGYGRHTTASWNNQIQPARPGRGVTASVGYAASPADSFPWNPPLDKRVRTLDFGKRSHGAVLNSATFVDVDFRLNLQVDITRTTQLLVNGELENRGGWLLTLLSGSSGYEFTRFRTFADLDPRFWPFVRVVYENRPWRGPWPDGRKVAYSFTSDDGLVKANDAWSEVFASFGLGYTAFVSQQHYRTGEDLTRRWDESALLRWFERGIEIGSHGRTHPNSPGLAALGYDQYDELVKRLEPGWIDSTLAAADGRRKREWFAKQPGSGTVFASPHTGFNLNMVAIVDSLGYLGFRVGQMGQPPANQQVPGDSAGITPLHASSKNPYVYTYGAGSGMSFNGLLVPTFSGSLDNADSGIFGTAAAPADSAAITRTAQLLIEDRTVRGQYGQWLTLTHNLNLPQNGYADTGVNPDQLRWFLRALVESGDVWIAPMGEVMRYMRAHTVTMDHPTNGRGGNAAWRDRFTGERRIWRRWLPAGAEPVAVPAGRDPARPAAVREPPSGIALDLRHDGPNPFNPRTAFVVTLPGAQAARLTAFDLRGRRVRRLHDGPLPAGATRLVWDGTDDRGEPLASGIYLLRLQCAAGTRAQRVSLVR